MSCVDVEYLDTVGIDRGGDAIEVNAVTDEKRVTFARHKPVVVLTDHIDFITGSQKAPGDFHRLPPIGMIIRHGLSRTQEESLILIAEENTAAGFALRFE
jgi:hypothetical protein